ncbi:hypothetical protein S101258_00117 [Lactiplantibacillus plantarum subsp. plantarum]|uniref:Rhodanese domain-containing protein n=1 Tax=Lactiplantibacillus plantarum subsp. plantarum TaxID=337330 RepID=A0A2S3UAM5_LACPN|nr:hypothetical protein S101258_00117 [Lactiplantibacillus plantarum subsp. plantarum]
MQIKSIVIIKKFSVGTRERLDSDNLHAAVDLISKARRVYLYGLGSSGYTAQEMTQRLIRMGIAAFSMTDTHIMYISGGIMQHRRCDLKPSTYWSHDRSE